MNIKKSIFKIFSANCLQLISGILVGFFVPVILSIEDYADLKTYTLYLSYIGLFHLGFIDGMYIKYGGKNINEINQNKLKAEHNIILLIEVIFTIIIVSIGLIVKNIIIVLLGISIIPAILSTFYKSIYQATGEFKKYSNIIYVYTIIYTIVNLFLVLIKNNNYITYCISIFISYIASIIWCEVSFYRNTKKVKTEYSKELIENVKVGFFILLGNLSFVLFTGADKWFIKIFFTDNEFAYYSFAISMLNIINTLISAISVTFYNYLFNIENKINKLKEYLIILGGMASASYFVLSIIVKMFMTKYIPSLSVIAITFATIPYIILINALFMNLYKIKKDEKKYFKIVVIMVIISIIYNIIAILIGKNITYMDNLFIYRFKRNKGRCKVYCVFIRNNYNIFRHITYI